jgi:hypothetical protein
MRVAIIILAVAWGIAAILGLVRARHKSTDARMTAVYFLAYPVIAVGLFLNAPVPLWLGVPTAFGFIPWLMAGPHLWRILDDPSRSRADEWIGIPKVYWAWGGLGAILIGILFN